MPHLIYEKRNGIAYLTMNRPEKRNALTPEMVIQLAEAWTDFRDDGDARVAILTGAGDRAFCAGADLARLIPLMTGARSPTTTGTSSCSPTLRSYRRRSSASSKCTSR